MKLKSILSAGLFATAAALSFSLQAADADKKVKPHSHMEEKTGMPQPASAAKADQSKASQATPEAKADKPNAAADKAKHYHPRDGK